MTLLRLVSQARKARKARKVEPVRAVRLGTTGLFPITPPKPPRSTPQPQCLSAQPMNPTGCRLSAVHGSRLPTLVFTTSNGQHSLLIPVPLNMTFQFGSEKTVLMFRVLLVLWLFPASTVPTTGIHFRRGTLCSLPLPVIFISSIGLHPPQQLPSGHSQ